MDNFALGDLWGGRGAVPFRESYFAADMRKALSHRERAFLEEGVRRQRQRVVIRNPISAIPSPIARFQLERPGIGYCMPEM